MLEEFIKITEPNAVMPAVPQAGWAYADCISGDGWSIAYRVFDAQYWGAPQRRRRIYLVADFRGECAQEILFKRESLRGYFEAGKTPWQGIAADAQNCVGTAIGGVDRYNQSFLPGLAQSGGDCTPTVLAPVAVYCHQGNGIDRAGKCLTAYSFDSLSSNSMKSKNPHSGCRAVEIAKTLDTGYPDPSKNQGGIAIVEKIILDDQGGQHIVRRLTPTECARLQGFPDWWGEIPKKDNLTDDEYTFWLNVRNTYAKINNKTTKEYSKEQMLSWYNKLHSDSSEYKMWGNGIALPNALYVMQGIAEVVGVHHSK